ncbi:MAG: DUF6175 family protein [bacterium]
MRTLLKYSLLLSLSIAFLTAQPSFSQDTNLPVSREASLLESYSPTEWNVKAAGIGGGKKKEREKNALDDARKCALYFCLYMGTDPLLATDAEKSRFALIEETFFDINNVRKYLSWEGEEYLKRLEMADKRLKIEKAFRINVGLLKQDLISLGVLISTEDLTAEIGMPQIMVIPEVAKGANPLSAMDSQSELKHGARAIESYLTARRYEVIVPEQQEFLNNYGETMKLVEGASEDLSHKIALAIGSDIYITYSVTIESRYVGSSEVKKAAVSVRALETTTARLLGTETGYSFERPASDEVVTEEAIHDAVDKVLARVNAYWKEDLQRGVQYKVIFSITGSFDDDQIMDIQDTVADVIAAFATRSKENVATNQTMDYLVWVKPQQVDSSRKLYNEIRDQFQAQYQGAQIKRQQLNRKLLLLEITNS